MKVHQGNNQELLISNLWLSSRKIAGSPVFLIVKKTRYLYETPQLLILNDSFKKSLKTLYKSNKTNLSNPRFTQFRKIISIQPLLSSKTWETIFSSPLYRHLHTYYLERNVAFSWTLKKCFGKHLMDFAAKPRIVFLIFLYLHLPTTRLTKMPQ